MVSEIGEHDTKVASTKGRVCSTPESPSNDQCFFVGLADGFTHLVRCERPQPQPWTVHWTPERQSRQIYGALSPPPPPLCLCDTIICTSHIHSPIYRKQTHAGRHDRLPEFKMASLTSEHTGQMNRRTKGGPDCSARELFNGTSHGWIINCIS